MKIYADAARKKFAALCNLYGPPVSYWRLGNAFDTIIDYLENVDASAAAEVGKMVVEQYQASLDKLGGCDNAWFDDFGWWTIATQRGVGKPFLGGVRNELTGFMKECWGRFSANAPYVWDRRPDGKFDDCRPAVLGGVWNEYWAGTSAKYPGPKGADPSKGTLEGIQNTVTNAVYLIAAQRLGRTDPQAKAAADKEYAFLNTWLFSEEPKLWWALTTGQPLGERKARAGFPDRLGVDGRPGLARRRAGGPHELRQGELPAPSGEGEGASERCIDAGRWKWRADVLYHLRRRARWRRDRLRDRDGRLLAEHAVCLEEQPGPGGVDLHPRLHGLGEDQRRRGGEFDRGDRLRPPHQPACYPCSGHRDIEVTGLRAG